MSNFSRLSPPNFLTIGVLSGALLLAPFAARAQDAPALPPEAPPTAPPDAPPGQTAPAQQDVPAAPPEAPPAAVAEGTTAANANAADTTAWTTFKGDAQRTGNSSAAVTLPLSLQWRFSSIGPARTYSTAPLVIGAPGNQRVVFASGSVVYANDIDTGAQVWKSPALPSSVAVPLTLLSTDDGDLILALQSNGRLAALKTADGGRAWEVDCGALATEAGPLVVNTNNGTRIICALNTGRLIAVDPKGAIDKDWKLQIGGAGTSPTSSMALAPDGSRMFVLGSDSQLYMINVREARVLYSLPQTSRTGLTPVASRDLVYTANARRVSATRISDGGTQWSLTPTGGVLGSPALLAGAGDNNEGGTLFFGTRDGQFMAVDAAKGTVKWQKQLLDNMSVTGSPLVVPGLVLVGTGAGTLMGFNSSTGDVVWEYRLQTERAFDLTPQTGRNGRGRGGGRGGLGGRTTTSDAEKRSYGVSSAPAAINGKIFVLGDNAALYAFTSQPFDAEAPRVVEPSIAVNASDRDLLALLLSPGKSQIVPGVGPIYFAAQMDDVGSGIDPNSIAVSINDKPLEAARVAYSRTNGVLTVTLVDTAKNDPALTDGLKKIVVTAKDYAGNTTNFSTNFLVDNTAPAPTPPNTQRRGGFGGRNGGNLGGPDNSDLGGPNGGNFGGPDNSDLGGPNGGNFGGPDGGNFGGPDNSDLGQ